MQTTEAWREHFRDGLLNGFMGNASQRALYAAHFATRRPGNPGRRRSTVPLQCDIADDLDVSERSVRKAAFILRHGSANVIESICDGSMHLEHASRIVRDARKRAGQVIPRRFDVASSLEDAARVAVLALPPCCTKRGYTYIIGAAGMVKIGKASDVPSRVGIIQRLSPIPLSLLAVSRDRELEAALHARFSSDRRHGEWFVDTRLRPWLGAALDAAACRGVCIRCAGH